MMDGVASNSLLGLPTYGDILWLYYILCMSLGFFAPQANGRPIFAILGKALWEQCTMPPAVLGAIHVSFPGIAQSGTSPNLDRDKMFNELWWLNYCFYEGIDIGAVCNPFFGGEAVNIASTAGARRLMWATPSVLAFVFAFALTRCSVNFGGKTAAFAGHWHWRGWQSDLRR